MIKTRQEDIANCMRLAEKLVRSLNTSCIFALDIQETVEVSKNDLGIRPIDREVIIEFADNVEKVEKTAKWMLNLFHQLSDRKLAGNSSSTYRR
jgi:hypothetical protein